VVAAGPSSVAGRCGGPAGSVRCRPVTLELLWVNILWVHIPSLGDDSAQWGYLWALGRSPPEPKRGTEPHQDHEQRDRTKQCFDDAA